MFSARDDGPRPKPIPANSLREEPKIADLAAKREERRLAEYRDQVDQGLKVAFPDMFDGLGADPEPCPLDAEEIQLIGHDLIEARADLFSAVKVADRSSDKGLHMRLMSLVAEVDSLTSDLANTNQVGGAA